MWRKRYYSGASYYTSILNGGGCSLQYDPIRQKHLNGIFITEQWEIMLIKVVYSYVQYTSGKCKILKTGYYAFHDERFKVILKYNDFLQLY